MQGRDARARMAPQHREMEVVAVEVDDVELRDIAEDHLQLAEVVRERLSTTRLAPQPTRAARDQFAAVRESPVANSVTSCPSPTSSSVNHETTRSVPPYNFGGTLS